MDDTSCIVQAPGHTPKPEFPIAQVCGGGGGGEREGQEEMGREQRAPISKQREDTVTVHFFPFPKDLSLHFIDFFKVTFERGCNHPFIWVLFGL